MQIQNIGYIQVCQPDMQTSKEHQNLKVEQVTKLPKETQGDLAII
tara:strand:- start:201 stop:335 length:135 start_codon:yes stop_codon:yes gene_type:complete